MVTLNLNIRLRHIHRNNHTYGKAHAQPHSSPVTAAVSVHVYTHGTWSMTLRKSLGAAFSRLSSCTPEWETPRNCTIGLFRPPCGGRRRVRSERWGQVRVKGADLTSTVGGDRKRSDRITCESQVACDFAWGSVKGTDGVRRYEKTR